MTRRARPIFLLLAAVAVTLAVTAAAQASPPRSGLQGFACHSTLSPVDRSVSVTSVMRPLPGTRTLQVRLTLITRRPGVAGGTTLGRGTGDLGVWLSPSDPTLGRRAGDIWKLRKSVSDVAAPAEYRFRAEYRWRGAHGRVIGHASRTTGWCRERELRPDVRVLAVAVTPEAHGHRARYVAAVANRGATATGPFAVLFSPGGGLAPVTRQVASLAPRHVVHVAFTGPACAAAAPPTVVADPDDRVDDLNRANNTLTVTCPGA